MMKKRHWARSQKFACETIYGQSVRNKKRLTTRNSQGAFVMILYDLSFVVAVITYVIEGISA